MSIPPPDQPVAEESKNNHQPVAEQSKPDVKSDSDSTNIYLPAYYGYHKFNSLNSPQKTQSNSHSDNSSESPMNQNSPSEISPMPP